MKKLLKNIIHSIGYDIHRLDISSRPEYQLYKSLENFKIDLVLDIGANEGQFVSELRSVGYKDKIISFEPLSDAHEISAEKSRQDDAWIVHERCAIGDYEGKLK
jgi:hypothetical protein